MNEHKKFLLREDLAHDKEQTVLTENGISPNPNSFAEKKLRFDSEQIFICPFCLKTSKFSNFFIKAKNCYMAKCPNCKQEVRFKTLFTMLGMTGKEFADFVYPYTKMSFWKKVYPDFKTWNNILSELGLAEDFWNRYKDLRGDNEE